MNQRFSIFSFASALSLLLICTARAEVRLPGFFGDHMVLQRDVPIRIWGWGDAGASVTVSLGGQESSTTVDEEGKWQVVMPKMPASKSPKVLRVAATNVIEIADVLIGEVWLCSGQSNMEWPVRASTNAEAEIANANHPMIRHLKVARRPSMVPMDDIDADWQICNSDTVGSFTACGYFMARDLVEKLDVPIGLINSSWGGTRVEPWTPPVGFEQVEALQDIYQSVMGRTPGTDQYEKLLEGQIQATERWLGLARKTLADGGSIEASPPYPDALRPYTRHQDPTMLYNGMIHALVGYPIRGAIWYQGESNHAEGMLYYEKKKALIGGWRTLWGQGDFPFYFVQIAPYQYGTEDPEILPRFWEAQASVLQVPKTGMVVVNDIATTDDIHPPNKQDVGSRLALLALKNDYRLDETVAHSPEMESMQLMGNQLRIKFRNTGGNLKTRDGKSPSHFELIGPGTRGFQPADASIDGDSVVLVSADVTEPVAFRYAWNKTAEPNLTGSTGLPVGSFRGGEVPDFLSQVSVERDFDLVYDLDLGTLGKGVSYSVDRSAEVGEFDRIGYLLELDSPETGPKRVFVTVDAFTTDAGKIGVPTVSTGASFQQPLESMEVFSDVTGLQKGLRLSGNIEFWPNNYGPQNSGGVPGASNSAYDFGDSPGPPADGYGSMQIHNSESKQTVFALNHWSAGEGADVGIGNSEGQHSDWTFTGSSRRYSSKRLRVYVRQTDR